MNSLIERLGWMLIHSVWEGAVVWFLLQAALSVLRKRSAQARYLAACLALTVAAILPWITFGSMDLIARMQSIPERPVSALSAPSTPSTPLPSSLSSDTAPSPPTIKVPGAAKPAPAPRSGLMSPFLPWLVAVWALGVTVFACRLGISWRFVRRLASVPLLDLSAAWQRRLGELCRTAGVRSIVRAGETAAVAVPVVVGWLKPVILLPLGVLAQLPARQIEAILLHELAHIRRHDFLVNLLQSMVETLFFYHPAFRSISRRIRREREHVCDDLSVTWCRDPMLYAEALTTFEEFRRQSLVLAITGEGDLLARMRRILLGSEPRERTATLFASAGFLAIGVYLASMFLTPLLAVELMSDQERVALIQALQPPPPGPEGSYGPRENVLVKGQLKTEDDRPLPKSLFENKSYSLKQSEAQIASTRLGGWLGGGFFINPENREYYGNTQTGGIEIGIWAEGYAPLRRSFAQAKGGEVKVDLRLKRGFPASVQVIGLDDQPLSGVAVTASTDRLGRPITISRPTVQTDAMGIASFGQVEADSRISLFAFKPGWQMANIAVSQWSENKPFVWKLKPAQPTSGLVIDKGTHQPIAGAELILAARRESGNSYQTYDITNGPVLGTSDAQGKFHLETLAHNTSYYIYIMADGHPAATFPIEYGDQNRICELAKGFHLRGKILDPKRLLEAPNLSHPIALLVMYGLQITPSNSTSVQRQLDLPNPEPKIPFSFDNLAGGRVQVLCPAAGSERYEFDMQKDIDDAVIDLDAKPVESPHARVDPRPLRTVEIKIETGSGNHPTGFLEAGYEVKESGQTAILPKVFEVADGKAKGGIPVPTRMSVNADHLAGYWFAPESFDILAGSGSFIYSVRAVAAGAIHGGVTIPAKLNDRILSVVPVVVKSPPELPISALTGGTPQKLSSRNDYVTSPLPFGGTYSVILNAGPTYFASAPAVVDAEHPLVLGQIDGTVAHDVLKGRFVDEENKPIPYQEVLLRYHPTDHDTLTSHAATTDGDGAFTISDMNFAVPGYYEVGLAGENWEKSPLKIDGLTPQPVPLSLQRRPN